MIRDRVAIPSASYHVYAIAIHIKSAVCRSAGLSKQKCKIRQQSSFQRSKPLSCSICSTVQHLHSLRRARAASWTSCTHTGSRLPQKQRQRHLFLTVSTTDDPVVGTVHVDMQDAAWRHVDSQNECGCWLKLPAQLCSMAH
jgi:hypothetical protein